MRRPPRAARSRRRELGSSIPSPSATCRPAFRDETPYVVACIELDKGARIVNSLATDDVDAVHIEQRVEVFFDKVSEDLTIPKFRPSG
ncbi:MAG: OB-fold domain-containing protein [Alphaproteobacteria bacterium]|nr:OB-fold domain-containing protein [Alphaproteobacteria bacterium]